jgi:hypothetical protein
MPSPLENDLKRLDGLAFRQREIFGPLVESFHGALPKLRKHPDFPKLERVYGWVLAPRTLWPLRVDGLVVVLIKVLSSRKALHPELKLVVDFLGEPPSLKVQAVVAAQEFVVQAGNYESLVKSQHKFDEIERNLATNKSLVAEWRQIKTQFDVSKHANRRGVIRRSMVQERNFRPDWKFNWKSEGDRFQAVFDAFCHRWDLYGMEKDKPLLLKLSVNLTPHGTLVMVPSYWSFDGNRDLRWGAIAKLHRARGVQRQGPKMSQGRQERRRDAEKAKRLWDAATKKGLRGYQREHEVMSHFGWPPQTDPSKLRRLLQLAQPKPLRPPLTQM